MKSSSLISFTILLLASTTTSQAKHASGTSSPIPQLYFSSIQCSYDSPEIYYDTVGFPNLHSLFDEGKTFFGILMDKLESSVTDATEKEKLEKEWKSLAEIVTNSFDLAAQRIDGTWEAIIDDFDTSVLPWELPWRKSILVEQFVRLHVEYQMLEAVLKSGVKEIISSLQSQLVEVLKQLENKVMDKNQKMTEPNILKNMEAELKKLNPNFVGKLLTSVVQKAMDKPNAKALSPAIAIYLTETIDKMTLLVEAYKDKGDEFPQFWTQMAQIMKNEGSRKPMSVPDLLTIYEDEELVIQNVIILLTQERRQKS